MWFLNVVLPVAIGSYFVLKFKSPLASEGGNINLKEKQ
jgi:hypothetical protein